MNTSPLAATLHYCTINPTHTKKQIIMICLNKQCENSRLCCVQCVDEFHVKHQLISVTKFEKQFVKKIQDKINRLAGDQGKKQNDQIILTIKQYQMKINQQLNEAIQKAIKQYKQTIKQINFTFDSLFSLVHFNLPLSSNNSTYEKFYSEFNTSTINLFIKKLAEMENHSYDTLISTENMIKKSRTNLKNVVKQFESGFNKVMEAMEKNIAVFKKVVLESEYVPFQRRFSKVHKAQCLTVSEDQKSTKRGEGSGGYPINLLQTPFTPQNNEVSFKILQQPGNKGIWMGIAILDIVKNNNFLSCYGIGKGTYAIDQVGASHQSAYTWNHHDSTFNSQPKVGWQFHLGDIVKIKVDFAKSVVEFRKGEEIYAQPLRLDLGDIYAFAGATHLGDSLGIV